MLFETLKQSFVFLGGLYFGLIIGIVYEILNYIFKFSQKKIFVFLKDIIFSILFTFLFIFCLQKVNYGEFRIFILLSYFVGFLLERLSLGYLVDFLINKLYNLLKLIGNKLLKNKFIKRCLGKSERKESQDII